MKDEFNDGLKEEFARIDAVYQNVAYSPELFEDLFAEIDMPKSAVFILGYGFVPNFDTEDGSWITSQMQDYFSAVDTGTDSEYVIPFTQELMSINIFNCDTNPYRIGLPPNNFESEVVLDTILAECDCSFSIDPLDVVKNRNQSRSIYLPGDVPIGTPVYAHSESEKLYEGLKILHEDEKKHTNF